MGTGSDPVKAKEYTKENLDLFGFALTPAEVRPLGFAPPPHRMPCAGPPHRAQGTGRSAQTQRTGAAHRRNAQAPPRRPAGVAAHRRSAQAQRTGAVDSGGGGGAQVLLINALAKARLAGPAGLGA